MFSYETYKISKSTLFYRTATEAASEAELVFLKESETKTDVTTVSNTYHI